MITIKSTLNPTVITVSSGTYAVAGSLWLPVPAGTTINDIKWIPERAPRIPIVTAEIKVYKIPSSNGKDSYEVKFEHGQWTCECPGFGFRRKCKHIEKAKYEKQN